MKTLRRGIALSALALTSVVGLMTGPVVAGAPPTRRPNVLWICADDHAAWVCGTYGNRQVRTPHIDGLAADGLRFDRAFCNAPVCTASRQSFLTGRYPRTIGVTQLATALPARETTLAELLRDGGYRTAAIGKMHFNSSLRHGFETRIDLPEYQAWLAARGKTTVPGGIAVQPPWKPFRDPASIWLNSQTLPIGTLAAEMSGTWLADQAAEWLDVQGRQRRDAGDSAAPFFLMMSFYEPHSPFQFPVEFRGRHMADEFTAPVPGPEDDAQIPAIFRDLTPREKQGIAAAYYTSVEFLDTNVGHVLAALDRAGLAEETLVVYTGDHGYLLGQHGRFEKHCCYDPAIRAPLILRCPGRITPGTTSRALVEFVDLAPTLLEVCGVAVPDSVQGKSLWPVIRQPDRAHRDRVFLEYSENEEGAVRTERWKLIYGTGRRERQDGYTTGLALPGRTVRLFDLEADPDELTNLAARPEHATVRDELLRALAEHLRQTARQPELLPANGDLYEFLDVALQPHDVTADE